MEKVTGIKSVDFKVKALGHGVVNWNGPTTLSSEGKTVDNHTYLNFVGTPTCQVKLKQKPAISTKKKRLI